MKQIIRVETNAGWMIVTYDAEESIVRWYHGSKNEDPETMALTDIQDDSEFEMQEDVEDVETWLEIDYANPDTPRIRETIEADI